MAQAILPQACAPIPSPVVLTAENLTFSYSSARPVLEGVSLSLPSGTVTAIAGPNGAGKSTLLRLLLGLLTPASGEVRLGVTPIASIPPRRRARQLAYIPQRTSIAFAFTVREYIAMGRYAAGERRSAEAVDRAMARAEIADRADDPLPILSAGQQQRAGLARALAQLDSIDDAAGHRSRVLLADEPVSAMDPRHALHAMGILRDRANAGVAVAIVLHDLTLAARFCDRAVLLSEHGRVAAAGPSAESLSPRMLGQVFGVPFEQLLSEGGGPVLVPAVPR